MRREEDTPRSLTTPSGGRPASELADELHDLLLRFPALLTRYTRFPDGRERCEFVPVSPFDDEQATPIVAEENIAGLYSKILPEDLSVIAKAHDDPRADGSVVDFEYRVVNRHGQTRWIHSRSRPGPPAADGSITWRGILTDVTADHSGREYSRSMRELLERIATGAALPTVLDELCRLVERRISGARSSVLLLDRERRLTSFGAAPTLPTSYMQALEGIEIGPETGSCGTAMYYGTTVISSDVHKDPKWAPYRRLAAQYDLGACWSVPFFGADGKVAGSLSAYFEHPQHPRPEELQVLKTAAHVAGIACQRTSTLEALHATEEQLRYAQKMEAVGQLAGGIAHDFNNILTVIQGSASLLVEMLPPDDENRRDAELIVQASTRAENLTRQLLTFGRRQNWEPSSVSLNEVLRRIDGIVRRLLGERVDVRMSLDPSLPNVWIDEPQLEQVLVNLAVNARDAMPQGGRFEIATRRYQVEDETADLGAPAGAEFVRLEVRDNGVGMDAATLNRIFEPFFSTKPRESSSGLGLSVAFGIIERAGGRISAQSEPGAGARFRIDLPVTTANQEPAVKPRVAGGLPHASLARGRCVLLVEDEAMVRTLAARTLRARGYEVVEAEDGSAGLRALEARDGQFDLVVSDVVMPHMTGSELMTAALERWPTLPVLLMTGYADDISLLRAPVRGRLPLLTKPFTPTQLAREVERALGDGS